MDVEKGINIKSEDVTSKLSTHVLNHIYNQIVDIISSIKKLTSYFILILIILLFMSFLIKHGSLISFINSILPDLSDWLSTVFGILLGVFAIFQTLQSRQFVKLMNDVGNNNGIDPLHELGKQFLSLTVISLYLTIFSWVLKIATSEEVLKLIDSHNINCYEVLIAFIFWLLCVFLVGYLFDLVSMVYNLWKTITTYTMEQLYDED